MPRQILTDWTTSAGSGFLSVMYFDETLPVHDQRVALDGFWGNIVGALDDGTAYSIRTTGVDLANGTGALITSWSDGVVYGDNGDQADEPLPDAAQMLIRWQTGVVVGSRFLQGRTFVPGLDQEQTAAGNVKPGTLTSVQGFVNSFLSSPQGFGIWHRPVNGAGGSFHEVVSGSVWKELAVLRKRRA